MAHKKKHTKTERRGLPGGPNEMFTYVTGVFSTEGYKLDSPDFENPFNVIRGDKDGTPITMDNVPFSILGMDNLGNSRIMNPNDDDYKFPGSRVFEIPLRDTLALSNPLKDKKNIQLGVSTDFRNINPRFSTVLPTQTKVDVRGVLPLQYFDDVLPFDVKSQNQGNIDVGINQPLSRNTNIGLDFNIPLKGNSNKKMDPVISFTHRFGKGGTLSKAQDGQEIIRPNGDSYEYKREGDKFYTRKREGEWDSEQQPDWTLASGNAETAIREKIYGENVSDESSGILNNIQSGLTEVFKSRKKKIQQNIQELDTSDYGLRVIAYPVGHRKNTPGHIEAVLFNKETGELVNKLPGTEYKGYINRWATQGNKPVKERDYEDDEDVQIVDLRLPDEELKDFLVQAQEFRPSRKSDVHRNLGLGRNELPISAGDDQRRYDFIESNCATGVCLGLGLDPDNPANTTAGITDPNQVMDNILNTFSDYYDPEQDYKGNKVTKREGIRKLLAKELGFAKKDIDPRTITAVTDYLDGLDGQDLTQAVEGLSENPMIQKIVQAGDEWWKPLLFASGRDFVDAVIKLPDGTIPSAAEASWEQYVNKPIRENTPFDISSQGVDNIIPWWQKNVINPAGDALEDAGKSISDFFGFEKGGTVSWQWKGKNYSGPKIGEDENNIYARTHNGKVKTISKKQQGGSVSEIWQDVTGTPWSQAKAEGLTDGSYAGNIELRNKLLSTPSQFKRKPSNTLPPANTNSNAANATLSAEEINDKINKAKDFNSAFGIARDYYGANKIFEYNGKQFGTNLAGETFEPSEEDMVSAGLKPQQREKIYKQNRSVVSPYTDDNIVEFDEFEDFENIKKNNANLNRMDQADLIVSYQLANAEKPYLIVDENAGRMHLYYPGEEQPKESYPILSGSNAGDAQTVTKADYFYNGEQLDQASLNKAMAETGASSVDALMEMPGYSAETNWNAGNKSTGAGKFTIGTVNEDSGFYDDSGQNRKTPSFVLKNEDGNEVSTVIHTVPSSKSANRINALTAEDPFNMRMTNGCINGTCSDLIDMHNIHDIGEGSEIFILPEDDGNKFVFQNGQLNFKTSSRNRADAESYIDLEGNEQRGQGINKTRNTLNYRPIQIDIDKESFANDKFTYFDFNDEEEYNNVVVPFAKSLQDNKQQIMKVMQVDGDAYNDIAKVAFGILGNETNFGDTHSAVGNLGRAANKYFDRSGSSSPDYMSKYDTYGADENQNSVGLTQFRWKWVEKDSEQGGDLKQRLKTLGITSNKDFLDAEKAALGTAAILSYYYNNRKVDDIMQDLPRQWAGVTSKDPNRDVYTRGVAKNSKYFTIKEKTTFQEGGGVGSDILLKQAYAESTFRPKVTSSANAKGLTQIRPNVLGDYIKANDIEGDVDLTNVSNAVDVQKWYMNDLYNASFIDKENQSDEVRIAKTLAAYNWGRGNLVDFLNEKKADFDIYNSLDWVDKLPKETRTYVNKILGNNDEFNKDYDAAINNEKYTYIINEYKSIGGEISDLKIYRDYVNGKYDNKSNLKKAEAIYDKLNRVYYNKAGQVGMSAPNYIMSYLDEGSM